MKSKYLTWIGLIVVLMLVLTGASCQRNTSNDDLSNDEVNGTPDNSAGNTTGGPADNGTPNNTTPSAGQAPDSGLPSPGSILPVLKQETINATERIKSLVICGQPKTDLNLTIISSKFINTLSNTGLDTNWYIFTSPSDPANFYLVNMPRAESSSGQVAKRIIMPKSDFDFDFDVLPIPMDQWKISYADALKSAEEYGGSTFRAQHKTFEVSTILAYPAVGQQQLSWSVTYKATDSSGAYLKVQVNADTGEAVLVPNY
ncbi:MAG: hypothetical protein V1807_02185 [Patescibacteria group bacterium]